MSLSELGTSYPKTGHLSREFRPLLPNPLKINVSINKEVGSLLALSILGEYLWTSHVSLPSDNDEYGGSFIPLWVC